MSHSVLSENKLNSRWVIGKPAQQPVHHLVAVILVIAGAAGQVADQLHHGLHIARLGLQGQPVVQVHRGFWVATHGGVEQHIGLAHRAPALAGLPHAHHVRAVGVAHVADLHDHSLTGIPHRVGAIDQREVLHQVVELAPVDSLFLLFLGLRLRRRGTLQTIAIGATPIPRGVRSWPHSRQQRKSTTT